MAQFLQIADYYINTFDMLRRERVRLVLRQETESGGRQSSIVRSQNDTHPPTVTDSKAR